MNVITKTDCHGEDPIMILVERLRNSARLSTAPEMNPQGFPIEKNLYWRAAEALLSLSQERDRLREALQPFDTIYDGYAKIFQNIPDDQIDHHTVELYVSVGDLRRASSALSQHPGEGEKA